MPAGVSAAVSNIFTLVGTVMSEITGNSFLMLFMCVGLVGLAIGVFRKLKRV